MRKAAPLCVFAAAALHVFLGFAFIESAAPTYDEPLHLASGYSYWRTGRIEINAMDHPPLAEMISAAGILGMRPRDFTDSREFKKRLQYPFARRFLYENTADADRMVAAARRFGFLLWTALLLPALAFWARRLGGDRAAVAACAVYACLPPFLANNTLITTDAAGAAFFFLTFLAVAQGARESAGDRERTLWLAAAGLAGGCGLASKFNMLLLPPLALCLAAYRLRASPRALLRPAAAYLAACAVPVLLTYRFGQTGTFFSGIWAVLTKLSAGKPSYILGRHSYFGVWWYFPAALLFKTPLAAILSCAAGLASLRRRPAGPLLAAALPPTIYFLAASASKFQIGVRHILPVYPFLALWAGLGLARLHEAGGIRRAAAAVLAAGCLLPAWSAYPRYLSYFGEPARLWPHKHSVLVGSNLDWGQDLPALASELRARGNPPVFLAYFGTADPAYYGIRYVRASPEFDAPLPGTGEDPRFWEKIYVAASATNLEALYLTDKAAFAWLKERRPVWDSDGSVFLYDLTGDWEGLASLMRLLSGLGSTETARALEERLFLWRRAADWRRPA